MNSIRLIAAAALLATSTIAARDLVVTAPGAEVDFEGNTGHLPATVVATIPVDDISAVTFVDDKMTVERYGAEAMEFNVADVDHASFSGPRTRAVGFCPPSVVRRLTFETLSQPWLDMDLEQYHHTAPFTAEARETVDLAAEGSVALAPAVPTLYTIKGSEPGAVITVEAAAPVMLLLDNASLSAITVSGNSPAIVASAPGSVNILSHIVSSGDGLLTLCGEGAIALANPLDNTAAIRAAGSIAVSGGALNIHCSGYASQGIYADGDVEISNAAVNIITAGSGTQADDSLGFDAALGICAGVRGSKSGGNVTTNGARLRIKTVGGTGAAAIGAMHKIDLRGSSVLLAAFDDALNAVDEIQNNGSEIFATSEVDDAVDSNGALIFRGGTMYVAGPYPRESAFDNDGKNFALEGAATLVALGAKTDAPWDYKSTTPYIRLKSVETDKYVIIRDMQGRDVISFITPSYPGPYAMVVACPEIAKTTEYQVFTAHACVSAIERHGIITSPTWLDTPTLVTTVTSSSTK